MPLAWTSDLSVQVPKIDDDHKRLIEIINRAEEAFLSGCDRRIFGRILGCLADYAGQHFSQEEQVMRHFGYPQLNVHVERHEQYIERLGHVIFEYESGVRTMTLHTIELLKDWFEEHVRKEDGAFGNWLRNRFDGNVPLPATDAQTRRSRSASF